MRITALNLAASGDWESSMTLGDSLLMSVMGLCIVFFGLVSIIVIIKILSVVVNSFAKKTDSGEPAPETDAIAAPLKTADSGMIPAKGSLGDVALYDTDDKSAAMIMAIVANELGAPLNELRFISIKRKA
ncbi:MAG: OadG family protein [Oscillospiraceae bacterium]|jgi:Na+-transporting methylmalonyl-CoA/oxaloacetate decarboxylase gamma subunit|nr:OadG family protein [Oscillospiraceae bacterium]